MNSSRRSEVSMSQLWWQSFKEGAPSIWNGGGSKPVAPQVFFPQAALGGELIGDLLDMGIASLLTERHGTFD